MAMHNVKISAVLHQVEKQHWRNKIIVRASGVCPLMRALSGSMFSTRGFRPVTKLANLILGILEKAMNALRP